MSAKYLLTKHIQMQAPLSRGELPSSVPEAEVFPQCAAHGISHIIWSPLAQGVLTGKYRPTQPFPADSRFANDATNSEITNVSKNRFLKDATLQAVARLIPITNSAGMTLSTMVLAWALRRSEVASAITGASHPDQVRNNAAASRITLTDDLLTQIDNALGDTPRTRPALAAGAAVGVLLR